MNKNGVQRWSSAVAVEEAGNRMPGLGDVTGNGSRQGKLKERTEKTCKESRHDPHDLFLQSSSKVDPTEAQGRIGRG
jgi:hypothetical protein